MLFGEDALGEFVFELGWRDSGADVHEQVARPLTEREQAARRGDTAAPRGFCACQAIDPVLERDELQGAKRDAAARDEFKEPSGVGLVGLSRVGRAAAVAEPEIE